MARRPQPSLLNPSLKLKGFSPSGTRSSVVRSGSGSGSSKASRNQFPQEQLVAALLAVYGDNLCGLWIGDDNNLSGSEIVSCPGRIGGEATPFVPGVYFQNSVLGKRRAFANKNATVQGGYVCPMTAPARASFCVAAPDELPFTEYRALSCDYEVRSYLLGDGEGGVSGWYRLSGTTYCNGVAQISVCSKPAVYAVNYLKPMSTRIVLGAQPGQPTRQWLGKIGLFGTLREPPSIEQIVTGARYCASYYAIL